MLKYFDNDAARTTAVMDLDTETDILFEYRYWIRNSFGSTVDPESRKFLRSLWREVDGHTNDVGHQWENVEGGVQVRKNEDGTYTAGTDEELWPPRDALDHQSSDGTPKPSDHDTQSTTFTLSYHNSYQNQTLSTNDEDDTRTWITTTSSSSSSFSSSSNADTTPLAFRLISLLTNTTLLRSQGEEEDSNTSSEDDLGVD